MVAEYNRALVIFRRDLRWEDNTALLSAFKRSRSVVPCFIFTNEQTSSHPFRSINGFAFMLESLRELSDVIADQGGHLHLFHGNPPEVVRAAISKGGIDAVFVNKDYTPYSRSRDKEIAQSCEALGVPFHSFSDALLVEPSTFGKPDKTPYTVFTPFYRRGMLESVRRPVVPRSGESLAVLSDEVLTGELQLTTFERYERIIREAGGGAPQRRSRGGRRAGLATLGRVPLLAEYARVRDFPSLDSTSILSPHNKFGTVSIREVYWTAVDAFSLEHSFIRELFWRDFFTHIGWHFPHVFAGAFHRRFDAIEWDDDRERLDAWCEGMTGFPIVDAGMRELRATGYMHNRVRMIVASFLVKDLHLSWRLGEAFFAHHLTEYDPAVNNGSWQWAASTGCDAQPYFRIFNPWLQQKRFDVEACYIKRWIPELSRLSGKEIHGLELGTSSQPRGYPRPIVEHRIEKQRAEQLFRHIEGKD